MTSTPEPDLPRSGLRRTARMLSVPLGYAGRSAQGLGKRLTGANGDDVDAWLRDEGAAQLFAVLGELKGGAMKLGQTWSLLETALPEDVAGPYREQLRRLQAGAPPMPASRVQAVLASELGPDWRSRFTSLSTRPSAAASIGQVHQGVWAETGQKVAVKVQYPGAEEALRSDLQTLGRLSGVIAPMAGGIDVRSIVREITERISEETDYEREAEAQEQAARAFDGDADIVVPHVLAQTPRVLVTEWVEGKPLTAAESLPDAERNRIGLAFVRFLFRCPAVSGLLHADPHQGNFLLTDDGGIAVLDWGLAARLPDGLPVAMGRLLRAAADGDEQTLLAGLREEGLVTRDVDPAALHRYLRPFVEPATRPLFHFDREWARTTMGHIGADKRGDKVITSLNLPPEYVLLDRVWLGGVAVLCGLDCEAPFAQVLDEHLPGWHH